MYKTRLLIIIISSVILFQSCLSSKKTTDILQYRITPGSTIQFQAQGYLKINTGFPLGSFLFTIRSRFVLEAISIKNNLLTFRLKLQHLRIYRKGKLQRLPGYIHNTIYKRSPIFITSLSGKPYLFKREGDQDFRKIDRLSKLLLSILLPTVSKSPEKITSLTIPWKRSSITVYPECNVQERVAKNKLHHFYDFKINDLNLSPIIIYSFELNTKSSFSLRSHQPDGCTITGSGNGKFKNFISIPFSYQLMMKIFPEQHFSRIP